MRPGRDGSLGGRVREGEGGRGTWPRGAACEAKAGNVQRAVRVHVRDCRAEGEGQLGREGQGTESCGMPVAAAASAGWEPWTHCTWPRRGRAPCGRWEHGGWYNAIACLTPGLRGDQTRMHHPLGDGGVGRERSEKPQQVYSSGKGEGAAPGWAGGLFLCLSGLTDDA